MKFTMAFVAVVATVATASPFATFNGTHNDMPKCALTCLEKSVKETTDCKIDDVNCMCLKENQAKVIKHAPKCILKSCSTAQALKAKSVAERECKNARKAATALANNATLAQNTTIHARAFAARNTTIHGMAAIAQNSTANETFVSA